MKSLQLSFAGQALSLIDTQLRQRSAKNPG